MNAYEKFLHSKTHSESNSGFEPVFMPDFLFPFQRSLIEWAVRKGRAAIFADCGLGKTPMQLVWSQNVVEETGKPVLVLTPLAVSHQTVSEAHKFGMEAARCGDGKHDGTARILVTNYERLHHFNPNEFSGCVCDESSILKNFKGATKHAVTEFMLKMKYRLLCTATAAPNDHIELGTHSEAVGELGFTDMVNRFFKKAEKTSTRADENRSGLYRFRGHAEKFFWKWVCSWARAVRNPSDLGFDDDTFILPELTHAQHVVEARKKRDDMLFSLPAFGLAEEREERRRTLEERCERAAQLVIDRNDVSISWAALNDEGDLLEKLIPDCVQVAGNDSDEEKEEKFRAFESGQAKRLVTKSEIGGLGLNFQHCAHQTHFPSHSFERWYQSIRRSWRFGQKRPVHIDMITSEGEQRVLSNLHRKSQAAEKMFESLVEHMNDALGIIKVNNHTTQTELPKWL